MSRRPPKQAAVSLFPFLAVLICAMGALIVLLVVTTRMIRDETLKRNELTADEEPSAASVDVALGFSKPLPTTSRREPDAAPLIAPKPLIVRREVPPPPPDLSAQLAERQRELEALGMVRQSTVRDAERNRAQIAELQKSNADRRAVLERASTVTARLRASVEEHARRLDENRSRGRLLSGEIQTVRRELIERTSRRDSENSLRIETFDGRKGTVRRPIVIECLSDRYVFHPEGIELREDQLIGFSPRENPLLAGVQALSHYWGHKDGAVNDDERAYVLLVVRPEGIPAFYVARKFLSEYKQPFGYELIPRDKQLAFDAADAGATNICRAAIERLLQTQAVASPSIEASPFREVMRDAPRSRGNSSQSIEPEPVPTGEAGQYRFVRTPRGLELVRDDRAAAPAVRKPAESNPVPARPAVVGDPASTSSGQSPVVVGETAPKVPARPINSTLTSPNEASANEPPAETIPLREVAAPTRSDVDPFRSRFTDSEDIPWLQSPKELESEVAATTNGKKPASAPTVDLETFAAPQPDAGAPPRVGHPGIGPGNSSLRAAEEPAPGQVPERGTAFVRHLIIRVHADRIQVANRSPVAVTPGGSSDELLSQVLQEARAHMGDWGPAPRDFYWKPKVAFVVYPGGLHPFERVRPYFEQRELIADLDFEIDYAEPVSLEKGR